MSQYRDDQEAARHRIASLESKLAERDDDLAAHQRQISERDQEIARLSRELRSAGTARITPIRRPSATRFVVAGAMSAALAAGMVGLLNVRRPAPPPSVPAVTFAEPPPRVPLAESPSVVFAEPPPAGDEASQMRALNAKASSGAATRNELKLLKAICGHLGDQECRERAAALLAASPRDDAP
jgi:uncharacterized coiled-coil protein SlyX